MKGFVSVIKIILLIVVIFTILYLLNRFDLLPDFIKAWIPFL